MKHASLFAGIGGFDLAARWMGWETVWVSEIAEYPSRILAREWPNAPNLGDITKISNPPAVDILTGGFPCQDISVAGRGAGITGARSGLWKEYARIIGEVRPSWVVIENSPRLRQLGLEVVLSDLHAVGYDAEWHCIPASAVGAPHQRDRIWIVAYPIGYFGNEAPLADSLRARLEGYARSREARPEGRSESDRHTPEGCLRRGGDSPAWWTSEPAVGRVANGIPDRVDRITALGNAVVPLIPYTIFQAIDDVRRT